MPVMSSAGMSDKAAIVEEALKSIFLWLLLLWSSHDSSSMKVCIILVSLMEWLHWRFKCGSGAEEEAHQSNKLIQTQHFNKCQHELPLSSCAEVEQTFPVFILILHGRLQLGIWSS